MRRKTKGSISASAMLFVTSGLMASFLGVRQYDRATTEMAWVTSAPLQAGQVVTQDVLKQARVSEDEIGIENPRLVIGKTLAVAKRAGDTFNPNDFAAPKRAARKTLAQHVPQGRVLYSLKIGSESTVPLSQLNGGDRIDILVRGRHGVRTAATDVQLVGVMRPRSAQPSSQGDQKITSLLPQRSSKQGAASGATTLVLAVDPSHVYPLAHIGSAETVSIVLHSAHDVASGKAVSVTPAKASRAVEVVAGLSRTTVYVRQ